MDRFFRAWGLAVALAMGVLPSWAHDEHDDAPATPVGEASPRFSAASEDFELVGVLRGQRLALYLDHARDNSPVAGAQLEVEVGGVALQIVAHGVGEFEATLAQPLPEGETQVMATVTAGDTTDLLAGAFDMHHESHALATPTDGTPWKTYATWLAGVGLLAIGAAWMLRRRAVMTAGSLA